MHPYWQIDDPSTAMLSIPTGDKPLTPESEVMARALGFRYIRSRRAARLELDVLDRISGSGDDTLADVQRWSALLAVLPTRLGVKRRYRLFISIAEDPVELSASWLQQVVNILDEAWLEVSEPQENVGKDCVRIAVEASDRTLISLDISGNDAELRQQRLEHWFDELQSSLRGQHAHRLNISLRSRSGIAGLVLDARALRIIERLGVDCTISAWR